MPFYEYECTACRFYVEALQKISEPPLRKCPSCKKQTLKKLVSAPVFRLKGAGWYETDFKSDQEQKRNLVGSDEGPERSEAKEDKTAGTEAKEGAGTGTGTDTRGAAAAKPATSVGSASAAAGKRGQRSAAAAAPKRSSKPAVNAPRAAAAARPAAKPARVSRPAARPAAKKKTATKKSR
jgi:putative FmdB family regulatory protein